MNQIIVLLTFQLLDMILYRFNALDSWILFTHYNDRGQI